MLIRRAGHVREKNETLFIVLVNSEPLKRGFLYKHINLWTLLKCLRKEKIHTQGRQRTEQLVLKYFIPAIYVWMQKNSSEINLSSLKYQFRRTQADTTKYIQNHACFLPPFLQLTPVRSLSPSCPEPQV